MALYPYLILLGYRVPTSGSIGPSLNKKIEHFDITYFFTISQGCALYRGSVVFIYTFSKVDKFIILNVMKKIYEEEDWHCILSKKSCSTQK